MPANVDALVKEGMAALKEGRTQDADKALRKAVELDDQNEQAWLWLSAVVKDLAEREICLENVLALNPNNERAKRGLEATRKELESVRPPATPEPDPFAGGWDDKTFAGTGFDSNPYGSTNDPAAAAPDSWSDWNAGTASSVDWGANTKTNSPPSSGVSQPTQEEYDSWMAGLSIGGSSSSMPSTPAFSTEDSDFNPNGGTFGGSYGFADPAPENDFFSTKSKSGPSSNPFDLSAPPPNPFDLTAEPQEPAPSSGAFGDFQFTDSPDDLDPLPDDVFSRLDAVSPSAPFSVPTFGDEDQFPVEDEPGPFSLSGSAPALSGKKSGQTGPTNRAAMSSSGAKPFVGGALGGGQPPSSGVFFTTVDSSQVIQDPTAYFNSIPDEFQSVAPASSGVGAISPVLLISLVVLVVLNLGSLIVLLSNLGR